MTTSTQLLSDEDQSLLDRIMAPLEPERPIGMSERKWMFARCYLQTGNATLSARLAGYQGSSSTLAATASRVRRSDDVRRFLEGTHERAMAEPHCHLTMDELQQRTAAAVRGAIVTPNELKTLELAWRQKVAEADSGRESSMVELLDELCVRHPTESSAQFALKVACAIERAANAFVDVPQDMRDWRPPAAAMQELERHPSLVEFLVENGCKNLLRRTTLELD